MAPAILGRLSEQPAMPWWRRPIVLTAAVTVAAVVVVVGLVPAAREQVASWLGIGGVTVETVAPPSGTGRPAATNPATTLPATAPSAPIATSRAVASGLGTGLRLGQEIVSLSIDQIAGFEVRYPEIGLPDRQFVDAGGRVWLLYSARPGLPETQIPGVGMIVTQFRPDSPGITKRIFAGDAEFVETDDIFGLWLEGPHEVLLPEADGSAVDGRSAGNTLLWEHSDELTIRIETALSKAEAVAIAETFD